MIEFGTWLRECGMWVLESGKELNVNKPYWEKTDEDYLAKKAKKDLSWLDTELGESFGVPDDAPADGLGACACGSTDCQGHTDTPEEKLCSDRNCCDRSDANEAEPEDDFDMACEGEEAPEKNADEAEGGYKKVLRAFQGEPKAYRLRAYDRLAAVHKRLRQEVTGLEILMRLAEKSEGAEEEALWHMAEKFEY